MAFTFFFRDSHTLEQLTKKFLPYVQNVKNIKVWDAGCAMGPEPYTFAIIMAEQMGYFTFKRVHIDATDIDETNTFHKIITDAIYPEGELSRIPEDIFKKYFVETENKGFYIVNDLIKNRLKFTKNDLLQLKPIDKNYNIIICKNVLLHFQYEERVGVIKMFHECLAPEGFLTTEQTQPMPDECKHLFQKVANDANIYQKIG